MHIDGLDELPVRLAMIPVMRGRQDPVYPEVVRQALPEIVDGLHVVVWPVYTRVAMAEVHIRHDECAVLIQELRYLGELLGLEVARILEETLGQNDVESLVAEPDGIFKKVTLYQIGRGSCMIMSMPWYWILGVTRRIKVAGPQPTSRRVHSRPRASLLMIRADFSRR
jgi:hypothetical protein